MFEMSIYILANSIMEFADMYITQTKDDLNAVSVVGVKEGMLLLIQSCLAEIDEVQHYQSSNEFS